jgi:hypothetical protein
MDAGGRATHGAVAEGIGRPAGMGRKVGWQRRFFEDED